MQVTFKAYTDATLLRSFDVRRFWVDVYRLTNRDYEICCGCSGGHRKSARWSGTFRKRPKKRQIAEAIRHTISQLRRQAVDLTKIPTNDLRPTNREKARRCLQEADRLYILAFHVEGPWIQPEGYYEHGE